MTQEEILIRIDEHFKLIENISNNSIKNWLRILLLKRIYSFVKTRDKLPRAESILIEDFKYIRKMSEICKTIK